jgi:hypothetical protein
VGWKWSLFRHVTDPGFSSWVLLIKEGRCQPWHLQIEGPSAAGAGLQVGPEDVFWHEATVVTGLSVQGVPPALLVGDLHLQEGRWQLRRPVESIQAAVVYVPKSTEVRP